MKLFEFDNSYTRLPQSFYARVEPTPVAEPTLLRVNEELARELAIDPDHLRTREALEVFAGNRVPEGAAPIAMAYAGHQFGHFVPQLGDGRAVLIGEVIDRCGERRDIQLKGSGPTPFSRRGDGRAVVGPVLREYIISEAMHAFGIPTTRSLAAVASGEMVMREGPQPGAVLTRVAASHVRVGTFQFFAARRDRAALEALLDHVLARHYPKRLDGDLPKPLALLDAVIEAQARLVAQWLGVGFIHGVMNTDNTTISGETIDYGPCAFMDHFDPAMVFSSIDHGGRYAYGAQPQIIEWNLARLAETLISLIDDDSEQAIARAQEVLGRYPSRFHSAWASIMRAKLGLNEERASDSELFQELFDAMHAGESDFTNTFRLLCDGVEDQRADASIRWSFKKPDLYDAWAAKWRARLADEAPPERSRRESMRAVNPAFIPRNHRVEAALEQAMRGGGTSELERLLTVVSSPFEDQPELSDYQKPPTADERVTQTFCGT